MLIMLYMILSLYKFIGRVIILWLFEIYVRILLFIKVNMFKKNLNLDFYSYKLLFGKEKF